MLVTDKDFRDKDFRKQLSETVKAMMKMRVIPVFNENDAISTRKAPYKVCSLPFFLVISVTNSLPFFCYLCRILLVYFGIMTA